MADEPRSLLPESGTALPAPGTALRLAVVPATAALFPTVHYLSRNLTTARLPPRVEPSLRLYAVGAAAALLGSVAVGVAVGALLRRLVADPTTDRADRASLRVDSDDPLLWRTLLPDDRTLAVHAALLALVALWAAVAMAGVGPPAAETVLSVAVAPLGLPLLLLSPLAIGSHLAVVAGYVASAVWTATLARLIADATS